MAQYEREAALASSPSNREALLFRARLLRVRHGLGAATEPVK